MSIEMGKDCERLPDYPNLIRPSHEKAVANGKMGAAAANKAKEKRKSYKAVINQILELSIKDVDNGAKTFAKLARENGIHLDTSIREFQVLQALIEYLRHPNVWALEKFAQLSGEAGTNDEALDKLDEIIKSIDKKAENCGTNSKAE